MDSINRVFNIKILKDSIYFKIVFIMWTLLHSLTLGQYITKYFSMPIIIWGMILIVKNIFDKKSYINKLTLYSIYAFLIAYAITILINRNYNLIGNTKTLVWQMIMMLVLFMIESYKVKENVLVDIKKISKVIICITFLLSLISLLLFFTNTIYWVNRVDGVSIPLGYYYSRLWGIYVDPNQAATIAIISMLSSVSVFIIDKRINIFNIINIFVQYIFVVLTASRGGTIAFLFMMISAGYLVFQKLLKSRIRKNIERDVISIMIAIIISVVIVISEVPTRRVLAIVPNYISSIKNNPNDLENNNDGKIDVDRDDLTSSNGRIQLWKDGLKLSKFSPIFGFGDRNIRIKASELIPGSRLENKTVHNGFIHMLLSGGIVALTIMSILIIYQIYIAIKIIFGEKIKDKYFYLTNIISIKLGVILISTVFLTEVFYQNSFIATIFWIYLGYGIFLNKNILSD